MDLIKFDIRFIKRAGIFFTCAAFVLSIFTDYNPIENDSLLKFITFGFVCCVILYTIDIARNIINDGIAEQDHQRDEELRRKHRDHQAKKREEEQAQRRDEEEQTRRYTSVSAEVQMCFDIFKLPYDATFDDVKKKYRTMIKCYHPDRHSANDNVKAYANKKAQALNNAFDILKKEHFLET